MTVDPYTLPENLPVPDDDGAADHLVGMRIPRLDRGTEWFAFSDEGRIREVRAYFHSDPRNRSGNLLGFDHKGRGYTVLEDK